MLSLLSIDRRRSSIDVVCWKGMYVCGLVDQLGRLVALRLGHCQSIIGTDLQPL
jgi:hypothetical protein